MHHRHACWTLASIAIAACTYNEYNTYNEVSVGPDAGSPVGQAGAGQSGAGAGVSGAAGSGGQAGAAGAGGGTAGEACTGCLRLTASTNTARNIRLEFDDDQNLATSQMTWRMRVRDFTGDVYLSFYAESGSGQEDTIGLSSVTLNGANDWQDVGADLSGLPDFSPPAFIDAGGVGGNSFDPGFSFDKRKVERVGVSISPNIQTGVFTPFAIEIDSVSFSGRAELGVTFASNDGGLRLVAVDGAQIAGATLDQVDD
jgi:hypothetical protein